jgi:hypothetical protein
MFGILANHTTRQAAVFFASEVLSRVVETMRANSPTAVPHARVGKAVMDAGKIAVQGY